MVINETALLAANVTLTHLTPLATNITLTYFTPLTANVTLKQDGLLPWANVISIILVGVITAGSAILSSHLTRTSEERREKEMRKTILIQKQWETYSKLKGIQVRISYDFTHLYQARVAFASKERNLNIVIEGDEEPIREEMREVLSYARSSSIKLAIHRQVLYEIIALTTIYFPVSPEIKQKIESIDSWFELFEADYSKDKLRMEVGKLNSADELNAWTDKKFREIDVLVGEKVKLPLEDFSNYLKEKLSVE